MYISIANSVGSSSSFVSGGLDAPVATAATGVGQTSFTANWNAYTGAVVYLLDVSESSDFSTFVYENQQVNAPSTSYVVIGLDPNTTYYYRVRASTEALTDADYQAVLDYATTQGYTLPSAGQQTLQNQLLVDLKDGGIWAKLDTFAVFATDGDSDFALIDWKRLTDYTAINSPTFTADEGFQGNGTSSYIDSNYNPVVNGVNLNLDSTSFGYYQAIARTTSGVGENIWGIGTSTGLWVRPISPTRIYVNNSTLFLSATSFVFNANQLVSVNRPNNTTINVYGDGVLLNTDSTRTSSSIGSFNMRVFRNTTTSYNNSTISMVYAGGDLTAESADFYNAWNTYLTSL